MHYGCLNLLLIQHVFSLDLPAASSQWEGPHKAVRCTTQQTLCMSREAQPSFFPP